MKATLSRSNLGRIARSLLMAGGVVAAGALALTPAAEARDGHGTHGRNHDQGWHNGHGNHYRFVDVPRHMHGRYRSDYRYAYSGRTYYAPHHHYHAIYRYPVVVGGVVRYQPYAYCNDNLFVTAYAPLPRVVVGFNVPAGIHIHAGVY